MIYNIKLGGIICEKQVWHFLALGKKKNNAYWHLYLKKKVKCQYYNFWACSQFIKKQASQVWGSIQGKYFRLKEGGMGKGTNT